MMSIKLLHNVARLEGPSLDSHMIITKLPRHNVGLPEDLSLASLLTTIKLLPHNVVHPEGRSLVDHMTITKIAMPLHNEVHQGVHPEALQTTTTKITNPLCLSPADLKETQAQDLSTTPDSISEPATSKRILDLHHNRCHTAVVDNLSVKRVGITMEVVELLLLRIELRVRRCRNLHIQVINLIHHLLSRAH